jgi:type IV pilus assembly protein PilB
MATHAATRNISGLARALAQHGVMSEAEAEALQTQSQSSGIPFVEQVLSGKRLSAHQLAVFASRAFGVPLLDLSAFDADQINKEYFDTRIAQTRRVLPLHKRGNRLYVATSDPANLQALDEVRFKTNLVVEPVVVEDDKLAAAIVRLIEASGTTLKEMAALEDIEVTLEDGSIQPTTADEDSEVEDAPVVRYIQKVLIDAISSGASDIHFEPYERYYRIRYRLDGILMEVAQPPLAIKDKVASRIKVISKLDISEKRVPQDGRMKLVISKNRAIDFRVSTLPTLFGEKIVLRILDKGNLTFDLETFGIEPRAEQDLMEAIANPYGMVLVTGPTGSGKTTTLYSALSKINKMDVNIMTAEDPVEYNLFGINQVLVRADIGMTFAAALRAFLRQDPNVIMVGEIRDLETGSIAIKAALTGHMVLSTLHTNSAPETVTRLLDMGLEAFNVSSAINLVLAQRLVRRICNNCRVPYDPPPEELTAAKVTRETTMRDLRFTEEALRNAKAKAVKSAMPFLEHLSLDTKIGDLGFFKGRGCEQCSGTGLKGRQGVYEVMLMTPRLRKLVMQNVGAPEIRDAAIEEGMLTLRMDAWLKVMKGITTTEQMIRETSAS